MNRKELFKRWTAGYVQPELFYYPFKIGEAPVQLGTLHLRFIRPYIYDLNQNIFYSVDTSDYNTYTTTGIGYVIKNSKGEIVYNRKSYSDVRCHLYNVPYGKYYIKVTKATETVVNDGWHEVILNQNSDEKFYTDVILTPQDNGVYKTIQYSTMEENAVSIVNDNDIKTKYNTIKAYGAPKIELYENNNLFYTLDYKNSGSYDLNVAYTSPSTTTSTLSFAHICQSFDYLENIEVDYDIYTPFNMYSSENNLRMAHVHYIEYSLPRGTYLKNGTHTYHYIPEGVRFDGNYNISLDSNRERQVYSEITYNYSYSSGQASRIVYTIDYYDDGAFVRTETGEGYVKNIGKSILDSRTTFANLLTQYDNLLDEYNQYKSSSLIFQYPNYDGCYSTKTSAYDFRKPVTSQKLEDNNFEYCENKCTTFTQETQAVNYLDSITNPSTSFLKYYERVIKQATSEYLTSEYKFPYVISSLSLFSQRNNIISFHCSYVKDGQPFNNGYRLSNFPYTCEIYEKLGYTQYSSDYDQY